MSEGLYSTALMSAAAAAPVSGPGSVVPWPHDLALLLVLADLGIALAFVVIGAIILLALRQGRARELRGLGLLFGILILLASTTYVIEVWNVWYEAYAGEVALKLLVAVIALAAAWRLIIMAPRLVNLPSHRQLEQKNQELSQQLDIIREQERALRVSEQRYRRLVETASEGIWVLDRGGSTTFVNQRMAEMLGLPGSDMLGRHFLDFVDDGDRQQAAVILGRQYEPAHERHDFRFRRRDGRSITTIVASAGVNEADNEGQVGLLLVVTDISERENIARDLARLTAELEARVLERTAELAESTQRLQGEIDERRRTEARYREKEQNLSAILNGTAEGIICTDRHGVVESFNPAAETLFGYAADEIIGSNISSLMPLPYRDSNDELLARMLDEGQARLQGLASEVKGVRRDGSIFPMELSLSTIEVNGETKCVSIVRDITDRKGAEISIQSLNADLALRTAELIAANQRLESEVRERRDAEVALQDANERLQQSLARLREHTGDMQKLNSLAEMLQSGRSLIEASQIIGHAVRQLWVGCQGAIYLARPAENALELAEEWGDEFRADDRFIVIDECWATRLGKPFLSGQDNVHLRCRHARDSQQPESLCVPLLAQGQLVGMVHLRGVNLGSLDDPDQASLVQSLAEHSALGLSNIKLRESLQNKSERDELTGLYNRRFLQEQLTIEHARARRSVSTYAILIADIDHFKRYNDQYGHDMGDYVLCEVAKGIASCSREGDIVARYGGEEFVVFLPGAALEVAVQYAERVREVILHGVRLDHNLPGVTLSIGVAVYPNHADTWQRVIKCADEGLYKAKEGGRNQVCVLPPAL